jgi:hypothetical protein
MITEPTVLILGAGASMPYGMPSGPGLKQNLLQLVDRQSTSPLRTLLVEMFGADMTDAFRQSLEMSGKKSVDAFLEHRPDFLSLGKAAIAGALLPLESLGRLHNAPQGTYEYLFSKLSSAPRLLRKNRLSIVTLNYERTLEYYLLLALTHSYDLNHTKAIAALRHIPIVHLYGSLGTLPRSKGNVAFGSDINRRILERSSESIRIIHEGEETSAELRRAHVLLSKAERVIFLGFGYDPTNLRRLLAYGPTKEQTFFGSAVGMTDRECRLIVDQMSAAGCKAIHPLGWQYSSGLDFLHQQCPFEWSIQQ